eukprot:92763-Rhodomonas_salina.2
MPPAIRSASDTTRELSTGHRPAQALSLSGIARQMAHLSAGPCHAAAALEHVAWCPAVPRSPPLLGCT